VDYGQRIAYTPLAEGTPVVTRGGLRIGVVKRVLADYDDDIFDGLILDAAEGDRDVGADHIAPDLGQVPRSPSGPSAGVPAEGPRGSTQSPLPSPLRGT
jgi:hypothetical protein